MAWIQLLVDSDGYNGLDAETICPNPRVFVDLRPCRHDAPLIRDTIIELRAREIAPRPVDRAIAEIASRNHGLYSVGLHGAADPAASAEFIQTHVRRLEAMRRQGLAERRADGGWRVGRSSRSRGAFRGGEPFAASGEDDRVVVAEPRSAARRRWRDMA